jgi:acetyl-CoA carboxylase biotin carboxyl carrier protein
MKLSKIKELIKLIKEMDIEELEIKGIFYRLKIRQKKEKIIPKLKKEEEKVEVVLKEKEEANITFIKAPLVGTFYTASSPGAPPYVEIGDEVKVNTIVGIIEAMKVMNEIEAGVNGIIKEVLVKNESPVEYGQPLFKVERK